MALKKIIFTLTVFYWLIPNGTLAQSPSILTYRSHSLDGVLAFQYLSNWSLLEESGDIYLSDQPDFFENGIPEAFTGTSYAYLRDYVLDDYLQTPPTENTFKNKALAILGERAKDLSKEAIVQDITFSSMAQWKTATLYYQRPALNESSAIVLLSLDDLRAIRIQIISSPEAIAGFMMALTEITATFEYTPPIGTNVIWSFQSDTLNTPSEVELGPEDRIYVASQRWLKIISPDGVVENTIDFNGDYLDFAVDKDGSLWALNWVSNWYEVLHLDAKGAVLKATTLNIYRDEAYYIPIQLELGPDNKLYVLLGALSENGEDMYCWFQVLDQQGNLEEEFFAHTPFLYDLTYTPIRFDVGNDGLIYLSSNTRFQIIAKEDRSQITFITDHRFSKDTLRGFYRTKNAIYIAGWSYVYYFDANGTYVSQFNIASNSDPDAWEFISAVIDVVALSNGDLVVVNRSDNTFSIKPFSWQAMRFRFLQ